MSQGFYEMIGVRRTAPPEMIRTAFQGRLAALVRRLKSARKQGADVSLLEAQERSLREAVRVLSDPARRRRYNAFLDVVDDDIPTDASELWERCRGALMDPVTVTAVDVVRNMTNLPISDGLPSLPPVEALPRSAPPRPAPRAEVPRPKVAMPPRPTSPHAAPPPLRMAPTGESPPRPQVNLPPRPAPLRMPSVSLNAPSTPPQVALPPRAEVPLMPTMPAPEEETPESLSRRLGFDGRFLKAVRESQGMSLEALAQATRISRRYLEAIEDNGFERLPAATFVRGYVKEIVRELDIEHTGALQGYMDLFKQNR